jgi:hypothetical protein
MNRQELQVEILFIENFCASNKKTRLLNLISSQKGRKKFLSTMYRLNFLDFSKFEKLTESESERILLATHAFTDCYLISDDVGNDKIRIEKEEAIKKVVCSDTTTLMIFGNAEIVYCEGEGLNNRWISKT